ncbi:MAG: GntR family transcriptional regulator [Oscillospiraceae bacterium]|nr:GntR family transcriptional regulator [Oscillospiraceae bacterium]
MRRGDDRVYLRIAQALEDDILSGLIREHELVPSTNQYAEFFKINPATAAKGVAMLAGEGMLYKKRGVGLFVAEGARERILEARRADFRERFIVPLLEEAHRIGVSKRDLVAMVAAERG